MVFTVSLLGAHHEEGSVGNKPATLIDIVWLRHLTLYLMPPYLQEQTGGGAKQSSHCSAQSKD